MHRPQDAPNQRPDRAFPGGKVRLPRLGGERTSGPVIDVVDTAFLGGGTAAPVDPGAPAGFTDYFTYESLFEQPAAPGAPDPDDPFVVLRLERNADWPTIVAAHRSLAKEFHPDRFVGRPIEEIARAEHEIKRVNQAYAELRRLHAPSQDRRSGVDRRKRPR